jgi:hypothetical protein
VNVDVILRLVEWEACDVRRGRRIKASPSAISIGRLNCTIGVERNQHIADRPVLDAFFQDELLLENFDSETPKFLLVGKLSM